MPPRNARPITATQMRLAALNAVTEKQFQGQVEQSAKIHGYRYFHPWNSQHSVGGFPDLVLVREIPRSPRILFAELKREKGRGTAQQVGWLDALHNTGGEVFLWRPSDSDEIDRILRSPDAASIEDSPTWWYLRRDEFIARMPPAERRLIQRAA